MNNPDLPAPVPTLTELAPGEPGSDPAATWVPLTVGAAPAALPAQPAWLVQQVLNGVQQQLDWMLEARLREAMAPALARAVQAVIDESREPLAAALRELVERAVAQEISRQQPR
jgi:hypothetical protein